MIDIYPVSRGGSFVKDRRRPRCACRAKDISVIRWHDLGIRVVVSGVNRKVHRMLRSGSFDSSPVFTRCTYHEHGNLCSRYNDDGFRVMVNRIQKRIEENSNA